MKTKLSALTIGLALAFGAGTAIAAGTATIDQPGTGNTSNVEQQNSALGNASATINQGGNYNAGTISQNGNVSYATATIDENQGANYNRGTITQTGNGNGAQGHIQDWGSRNTSTITQVNVGAQAIDPGVSGTAYQNGNSNTGSIYQHDGKNLVATINAGPGTAYGGHGSNNNASISQTGVQQTAAIEQNGSTHGSAVIDQSRGYSDLMGNDVASITDTGSYDSSRITQVSGGGVHVSANKGTVIQSGQQNTADVSQVGYSDTGAVNQSGYRNYANINQLSGTYQHAAATQSGSFDTALISQANSGGDHATTNQSGNFDLAIINQANLYGNPQTATVTQTGSFDLASVNQSGVSQIATVAQAGNFNAASVTQASTTANYTANVTQGGFGNVATVYQH